jgi:hypothetical protein
MKHRQQFDETLLAVKITLIIVCMGLLWELFR